MSLSGRTHIRFNAKYSDINDIINLWYEFKKLSIPEEVKDLEIPPTINKVIRTLILGGGNDLIAAKKFSEEFNADISKAILLHKSIPKNNKYVWLYTLCVYQFSRALQSVYEKTDTPGWYSLLVKSTNALNQLMLK